MIVSAAVSKKERENIWKPRCAICQYLGHSFDWLPHDIDPYWAWCDRVHKRSGEQVIIHITSRMNPGPHHKKFRGRYFVQDDPVPALPVLLTLECILGVFP